MFSLIDTAEGTSQGWEKEAAHTGLRLQQQGGVQHPRGWGQAGGHSRTASPYPWEGPEEGGQRDQSRAGLPIGRPAIHGPEPPALLPESLPPHLPPCLGPRGKG